MDVRLLAVLAHVETAVSSAASARSGITSPMSFRRMKLMAPLYTIVARHGDRLNPDLPGIAEEQAVGQTVEALLREHAGEQGADGATHAVRRHHVERIVQLVLVRITRPK